MVNPSCSSLPPAAAASEEAQVKYKGVRKRKWGKWVSEIRLPNSRERIWLGSYDSAEKAARAFDAALFCLRGRNAKFNFADNLPDLEGDRPRTPAEIQAVASKYANKYKHEQQQQQQQDDQDTSPVSSNSDGALWNMDWSFLDLHEPNGIAPGATSNVPDYDLMLSSLDNLHEDMYMNPHLGINVDDEDRNINGQEEDEQHADHDNYSHQSFLWNF